MKRLIATLLLLTGLSVAQVTTQTCHRNKSLLWANPITHVGITLFCQNTEHQNIWAVTIYGTHKDWQSGKRKLVIAYLEDHRWRYIPAQADSTKLKCLDHGSECLKITYGALGERRDGTEWVQTTLNGEEH